MSLVTAVVALFALGVGLWLFVSKFAPKTTILLFLVAGMGIGGTIGVLIGRALNTVLGLAGSVSGQFVGVGTAAVVSLLALIATLEIVVKGVWPKKAKPKRWHPWLALVLPTIVAASGLPIVDTVLTYVGQAAGTVGSLLG